MNANALFENLLRERSEGFLSGIYSVCSANPIVIEASMDHARDSGHPLLIEATSNQVNQYGGYTGMKPEDFAVFVRNIAFRSGFDLENVILGGELKISAEALLKDCVRKALIPYSTACSPSK